jgi:hypothetical protein
MNGSGQLVLKKDENGAIFKQEGDSDEKTGNACNDLHDGMDGGAGGAGARGRGESSAE